MQTAIFLRYLISRFLNLKYIEHITTAKQVFQFCLHATYLPALVLKHASLFL